MTRSALIAIACLLLASGCGVEGDPVPPDGQEDQYIYPLTYPAPQSVVPGTQQKERNRSRLQPSKDPLDDPFAPRTRTIEPVE